MVVQWLVPALEVVVIAAMVNYLLAFFWNTRAMDLMLGLLAFLGIFALAGWLNLPVLKQLMLYVVNVFAIAVLIIFQPEFRVALSKLSMKSRKFRKISEFDDFLETLAQMVYRMSERRIGALIVLENQDSLDEYGRQAVQLNAEFSPELVESIFSTTTPLHDGAVILKETTLVAASVILPLAEDTRQITRSMGTRHRAGLGISQQTDALVIVVSEENGRVSVARDGIMTRGIKIDRFRGVVRSIFNPPKKRSWWNVWEWVR